VSAATVLLAESGTNLALRWAIAVLFSAIVLTWTSRFVRSELRRRRRDR